jgi:phage terminase small subunit
MKHTDGYKNLSTLTRRWVNSIQKEFELESHHKRLLLLCGQAWDRAMEARKVLEKEGAFIFDRFNQRKSHPAVEVERQSMLTFARILRELGLDLTQPDTRPPARPGGYGAGKN